MKHLLFLLSACLLFSCVTENNTSATEAPPTYSTEEGDPMLYGPATRTQLQAEPYAQWFDETYAAYSVDTAVLDSLPTGLAGTNIVLLMGTWCEDSQREVPRFFKILDYLGIEDSRVQIHCLDEQKQGPEGIHETWGVTAVPTFVFLKDTAELGRIVEFPEQSLEKDMGKIFLP